MKSLSHAGQTLSPALLYCASEVVVAIQAWQNTDAGIVIASTGQYSVIPSTAAVQVNESMKVAQAPGMEPLDPSPFLDASRHLRIRLHLGL